jgi:Fe-S-cluster containining protein
LVTIARSPASEGFRQEISHGLFYTHTRISQNTHRILESSAFLYSVIELLNEKGLITIDELEGRKKAVAERLTAQLREKGLGVMLQDQVEDKYTFAQEAEIDCDSRLELCRAACCRLRFALSKQDIYEGKIQWDLGRPYLIAQGSDGYCIHLERETCRCTVREQRPVPCRGYDCRQDNRIWLDFENRAINPRIYREDWPDCEVPANGVAAGSRGPECQ